MKTIKEIIKEQDEKFEVMFIKRAIDWRENNGWTVDYVNSRADKLTSYLHSRDQAILEGAVNEVLDSFCVIVKNELKQQILDGFSLNGTDFDAVFESAKKTLLSTLKELKND